MSHLQLSSVTCYVLYVIHYNEKDICRVSTPCTLFFFSSSAFTTYISDDQVISGINFSNRLLSQTALASYDLTPVHSFNFWLPILEHGYKQIIGPTSREISSFYHFESKPLYATFVPINDFKLTKYNMINILCDSFALKSSIV